MPFQNPNSNPNLNLHLNDDDSSFSPDQMEKVFGEFSRVLKLEADAILECRLRWETQTEQKHQLQLALRHIQSSLSLGGKIIVLGVGKSGKIGQKIAATLASTGSTAVFIHPTEAFHGDLGAVSKNDVAMILSYNGNTEEIIRLIPSLKNLRIPIIGLGGNHLSELARHSDAWIDAFVKTEACPHNLAPTTSTTLALALGDALAMCLMQLRSFDAFSFARNHPGGSLGKRLSLKVKDMMHPKSRVGIVLSHSSMEEVIITATEKKLGAVLVVHENKLLGIITDGDIRRALSKKDRFFDLLAKDIMNVDPVVASSEMMASQALELMENRPSQISVLPVVNEMNEWVGLIRLHDLFRTF